MESPPPLSISASLTAKGANELKEVEMDPELPNSGPHIIDSDNEHEVFLGFGKEEEEGIFTNIEFKSKELYAKVQELESQHAATIAQIFALTKDPVVVPRQALATIGGDSIYIEKMIIKSGNETKTYNTGMGKIPKGRRNKRSLDGEGDLVIDEEPFQRPHRRPNQNPISNAWTEKLPFSQPELQLLRRPLILGWVRDVVLKSPDGLESGQVSYFAPDGSMVRSYKDLALALANYPGRALSRANFSFIARPIGFSKNETIRMSHETHKTNRFGGESVVDMINSMKTATPKKRRRPGGVAPNLSGVGSAYGMQVGESTNFGQKRRRRGRYPPKNMLMEKMQVNDSEGGLFGISALSEIFAGMEKADAERELEEYNHMMNLMAAQENILEALDPSGSASTVAEDGELVPRDEILPCSIRCPGMTGKIPGLQCTRCLCLYHAECLGFPEDDVDSTNFLCSNCEGSGSPSASPSHSPSKHAMSEFMHKMLDLKNPRMSRNASASNSAPQRHGFQGFGRGVSIKKVDPKTGNLSSIGFSPRNRRIPPIPQLTSHNLTITPLLPYSKGQIPRVPTLSPMNGPRNSNTSIPIFKRGRGGAQSTLIDSIQVNPQRQGNLSKHPFAPFVPANSKPKKRYPIPNFGASFGTVKQPTSNIFRNYPQSVVSVGQKKFIVIPKSPPPQVMKMFEQNSRKKCEEFGKQKKVLAQVFSYLTAKDLLKASRVNSIWREQAAESSLWTELRLKNTRIYNLESFSDFVSARETETIDFRKMLGSVDWSNLLSKLSSAPSLRTLVLGSKAEELGEILQKECPHLEVI